MAAVVVATLVRAALAPLLGAALPFVIYLLAAMFVVWYGGLGAAIVTTLLSAVVGTYFFIVPGAPSLLLPAGPDLAVTVAFLLITGAAITLFDLQRRMLARVNQEADRRRLAETAERAQRQRFEMTLSSIADAVITTDAAGVILFANAVAETILRCPAAEMRGKPLDQVFRVVHESTRVPVESLFQEILRLDRAASVPEHSLLIAWDGTEIPIDDSAAPIHAENGAMQGLVLVFRDTTARRRAENADRLVASIVDSSDDAIISKDLNGIITSWNRGAERIFGYSASEIVGRPVSVIYTSDPLGEIRNTLARIRRGERIHNFETTRKTKRGELINVSVSMSPLSDESGQIVGASTIARDISDRKRAEEELRATKEQLQVVTDNMAAAVTRCSRDFRYIWVSRGYAGWIGRSAEEIPGRPIPEIIGAEAFDTIRPYMEQALLGRKVEYTTQLTLPGPGKRWVHVVYVPTWAADQVDGWISVVTDLTDMLQAQLQLRESNSKLARANEDLERFAFAASHDLQEPLRLINTFAELLGKALPSPLSPQAAILLDNIIQGAGRMRELLSDLLVYSEVSARQPSAEAIDLKSILEMVQKNLQAAIEESGAVITAGPLPVVVGRRGHLISLFQNLIANAIKYRSKEPPRIRIEAQEAEGHFRFAVADNGIGIEPEFHEKIFGVFTRLHGKRIPGTGIGLAICQRVVERYGGRIWVESEPGRGATFAFTLPKPLEIVQAPPRPEPREDAPAGPQTCPPPVIPTETAQGGSSGRGAARTHSRIQCA